jgi:hypothetical protein
MAKKRTKPAASPKTASAARSGPEPKSGGALPNIISMRGSREWRAWLDRLAEACRATPSALIDRALAELARREGFEEPPRRT